MTKQEVQFQKRMEELANTAYRRDIPVFTNFLERNELHILHSIREFPPGIRVETSGGYEFAERQMAVFLPDAPFLHYEYPFVSVVIAPLSPKFSEPLTHRDYMGAVLNLGIDRAQTGDFVLRQGDCVLFCTPQIGEFLTENCVRIRHTPVSAALCPINDLEIRPRFREQKGSVSSLRLDCILAFAFHSARGAMLPSIQNGEVFVNSRLVQSNSYLLKEQDVVSVRGHGKFIFDGVLSDTKKGRHMVRIRIFD